MSTGIRENPNRIKNRGPKRFDSRRTGNNPSFRHRNESAREKEDNDSVVFIVKDILHAVYKCMKNGEYLVALFRKWKNASDYINRHRDDGYVYVIKEIETDF